MESTLRHLQATNERYRAELQERQQKQHVLHERIAILEDNLKNAVEESGQLVGDLEGVKQQQRHAEHQLCVIRQHHEMQVQGLRRQCLDYSHRLSQLERDHLSASAFLSSARVWEQQASSWQELLSSHGSLLWIQCQFACQRAADLQEQLLTMSTIAASARLSEEHWSSRQQLQIGEFSGLFSQFLLTISGLEDQLKASTSITGSSEPCTVHKTEAKAMMLGNTVSALRSRLLEECKARQTAAPPPSASALCSENVDVRLHTPASAEPSTAASVPAWLEACCSAIAVLADSTLLELQDQIHTLIDENGLLASHNELLETELRDIRQTLSMHYETDCSRSPVSPLHSGQRRTSWLTTASSPPLSRASCASNDNVFQHRHLSGEVADECDSSSRSTSPLSPPRQDRGDLNILDPSTLKPPAIGGDDGSSRSTSPLPPSQGDRIDLPSSPALSLSDPCDRTDDDTTRPSHSGCCGSSGDRSNTPADSETSNRSAQCAHGYPCFVVDTSLQQGAWECSCCKRCLQASIPRWICSRCPVTPSSSVETPSSHRELSPHSSRRSGAPSQRSSSSSSFTTRSPLRARDKESCEPTPYLCTSCLGKRRRIHQDLQSQRTEEQRLTLNRQSTVPPLCCLVTVSSAFCGHPVGDFVAGKALTSSKCSFCKVDVNCPGKPLWECSVCTVLLCHYCHRHRKPWS